MTLVSIAVDVAPEVVPQKVRKPRPTPKAVAAWRRRREARRTGAVLAGMGLGMRSARVLAGQAQCGQVTPYGVAVARAALPQRLAARELLGWVTTAYKWREALKGSASALAALLGVCERTAVSTAADLVAGGWLERHRRYVTCLGTDARCPRCHGAGQAHDRELANAYTPGPRLLAALREARAASEARQRTAAALGQRVRRQAAPVPKHESRSATVADRRLEPENERPGWAASGRAHPHPPDQIAPLRVAGGAPAAPSPDPEAARTAEHDSGQLGDGELYEQLSETLRIVQTRGAEPPNLRLRIPRPTYQRPPQRESETPCGALLAPGLYGPGGLFAGACECPRCRRAS